MRTSRWVAAAFLLCAAVAHADTWVDADNFPVAKASPYAMATDGTYLYVVGTDGTNAIVRRGLLSGGSFMTVDTLAPATGGVAVAQKIAYDSSNNRMFVAGTVQTAADVGGTNGEQHWYVRVFANGTWTPLHTGTAFASHGVNSVGGLVYSTNGQKLWVNLTAEGDDGNGVHHPREWFVKRSTDSTATDFTTIKTFTANDEPHGECDAGPIGFDGTGNVISLGYRLDTSLNGAEVHSYNGTSWSLLDSDPSYSPTDWLRTSSGDFYYSAQWANLGFKWQLRKFNGTSWGTVDSIAGTVNSPVSAQGMASLNGTIYAAGYNGAYWYVRKSTTGNAGTWVDSESFNGATSSAAWAIQAAGGKVWVAGNEYGSGPDPIAWVVRSLTP